VLSNIQWELLWTSCVLSAFCMLPLLVIITIQWGSSSLTTPASKPRCWAGSVAQWLEGLPSIPEALDSIPNTTFKNEVQEF
jgi:hypothetical protein